MNRIEFIRSLNKWGQDRVPFLFMVDFEMENPVALPLSEIDPNIILYDFQGFTNSTLSNASFSTSIEKSPIPFHEYKSAFDKVIEHLHRGDSFLTNLTISTKIDTTIGLNEIFDASRAKYKLLYKDQFVVFSPEQFIQIKDDRISSFPMKGTIDASVPDAHAIILKDEKELSEHITIVDLIRNDLSQVAERVEVKRFRYIEEVKSRERTLLQVSSEISGNLHDDYWNRIGEIIIMLLPAGSVSGAPKARTLEIIAEAEQSARGYYTGICGYFDGKSLDSGVLIRFIEKRDGALHYRSGGGITARSNALKEYQEAIDKIYIPVD